MSDNSGALPLLLCAGVGLWFWFGEPGKFVANQVYKTDAAPWETVDAFYYPDRGNLLLFKSKAGLRNVDDCRMAVGRLADEASDPGLSRGDYECGVGKLKGDYYGLSVYRLTVR
ncbi:MULTISPECIES: hypothetical protein [Rhizobium]|uniref:hypothetical protein n=1 Tax=Rhizobium TaxID=379 RepID=UPI001C82A27D|nr:MULTISPECIES: hypothetical protein [Rhizobium]MBX4895412.1 hypothetical protein [Rhizobium bangladeshense]MBX5217490.1 hypothetical protein [Rhizobium sp. NLR9a]